MFEYNFLLEIHSVFRWLVFISLIYSTARSYQAYKRSHPYTKTDDSVRHWTATIAHIQLMIGSVLYFQSPTIKYFWTNLTTAIKQGDPVFFSLLHMILMLVATTILTLGSAKAKRKDSDHEKFKTMFFWFLIALIIFFIAVPWPFSPLANRPYIRGF